MEKGVDLQFIITLILAKETRNLQLSLTSTTYKPDFQTSKF